MKTSRQLRVELLEAHAEIARLRRALARAEDPEQAARERLVDDAEARLLRHCVEVARTNGRISSEEKRRGMAAIDRAEGKEPTT